MAIIFRCPACDRDLEAPDDARGVTGSCKFCGAQITVPLSPDEAAGLVSPPTMPISDGYTEPPISEPTGYLDAGAVVSESWGYLKKNWAALTASYFIVGLITLVVMSPIIAPFVIKMVNESSKGAEPDIPNTMILGLTVLAWFISPLLAGPLYVADRIIARGDSRIGTVFQGFRSYGPIVTFSVLVGLPSFVITLLQMAVGSDSITAGLLGLLSLPVEVFLFMTVRLGLMEIVDKGGDAVSAIKASWEFTKGSRWMILATWILLTLAYMAGMLACFIGVFFTLGFIPLGEVLIYRHLRGLQGTLVE